MRRLNLLTLLSCAVAALSSSACTDSQSFSSLPIEQETQAVVESGEVNLLSNSNIDLIALDTSNTLAFIELDTFLGRPRVLTRRVRLRNVPGTLLGIDYRPATREFYAINDASTLFTLDPFTGTVLSTQSISLPFLGGTFSGFDFNPQADRLRLTGSNDQNFRIDVDLGVVVNAANGGDGTLKYTTPALAEINPFISASAYTNSRAAASSTQLFNIDTNLDRLVIQNPPNDGALQDIGSLTVDFRNATGFDILTNAAGINTAYAISGSTLYTINLTTGKAIFLARLTGALHWIGGYPGRLSTFG